MAKVNFMSVTVDRIGDGPRDSPVIGMRAHSVRIDEGGTLHIEGAAQKRWFGVGTWKSFSVERFPAPGKRGVALAR